MKDFYYPLRVHTFTNTPKLEIEDNLDGYTCKLINSYYAAVVDFEDKVMVNTILDFLKKEGYNTVTLIDGPFIKQAILEKLEREGYKNG